MAPYRILVTITAYGKDGISSQVLEYEYKKLADKHFDLLTAANGEDGIYYSLQKLYYWH